MGLICCASNDEFEPVETEIKYEEKEDPEITKFIKESKSKKEQRNIKYLSLTNDDIEKRQKNEKKAKELTKKLLNEKPSGNPNDKSTVLHVLSSISGNKCLFFDSSKGINLEPSQNSFMKAKKQSSKQEKPEFCLTLNTLNNKLNNNDEIKTLCDLKKCVKSNKEHPILSDYKKKLAIAHNVKPSQINIKDIFSGSTNVIYVIDLTDKEKNKYFYGDKSKTNELESNLKKLFDNYKSIGIHALLFRESYDINMFDDQGNKTFDGKGETFEIGPSNKKQKYKQPSNGWVRYGLKVLGKYGNDKWLHPFDTNDNWYRAYHGTGNASVYGYNSVDAMSNIIKGGFYKAKTTRFGEGVYCSPDPDWLENECYVTNGIQEIDTKQGKKKYKFMLQCCVNPDGLKIGDKEIWVAKETTDIRAYGILIKEV